MNIYYNNEGSIIISDIIGNQYIDRAYQGYTKREAIARFKSHIKECKQWLKDHGTLDYMPY